MLPDGWKDWKTCTSENLYVCLGLNPERASYYTKKQIEDAYLKRYEWFQKRSPNKNSPMWEGKFDAAVHNIQNASSILTNQEKKKEYDEKIIKEEREKKIKALIDYAIIPAIEKDKVLTPEEEENIMIAGKHIGLSDAACKDVINDIIKKHRAKRGTSVKPSNAFELFKEAVYATIVDGWLEPKEKRHLVTKTAKKLGISEEDAKKSILDCLKEKGAKEGRPKRYDLPEELQNKNYYEVFGLSEKATASEIEDVYKSIFSIWNTRASNPKYTPYVRAVKDFILEAKKTLLDPVRKRQYDENLKQQSEELDLLPIPPGVPILELNKTAFSFNDVDFGMMQSSAFIVKNGGGGALEATIKTTRTWLSLSHAKIHQKDLPLTVTVTVDTKKDKRCTFGFRETGYIKISYKKAGALETASIPVNMSVQTHYELARRLTNRSTVISTILSGVAAFYVFNTQRFSGWGIFGLIIAGIFGIATFNQMRKNNISSTVVWLIVTSFLLLLVKPVLFLVLLPIPITRLFSLPLFKRYPMKSSLVIIFPVIACGGCFIAAFFTLLSASLPISSSPPNSTFRPPEAVTRSIQKEDRSSLIKTEEEEFEEIMDNPDLNRYLNFIKKYPSNKRKNELARNVKLADPNLPSEKYWLKIKKNSKKYWEMNYKNFIWLVWIPPGKLVIGSESETHKQTKREISLNGFWIGKYEVSVNQYKNYCIKNNINIPKNAYKDSEPIRNVSWNEASNFCQWLGLRLPTELEWEKAARGRDYDNYSWGENLNPAFGNVSSNYVKEIGSYRENGFGLYDTRGNVEEWCQNWYSKDILAPPKNQLYKVLRGGSFQDTPYDVRIKKRNYMFPSYKKESYGFRVSMN